MKNILKVTLVLAFAAFLPALQPVAMASNQLPVEEAKPKSLFNVNVWQSASLTLSASWNSNWPAPYTVSVWDVTNGGFIPVVFMQQVFNNNYTLGGLTLKHKYLFNVQDNDSVGGGFVTITF